MTHAFQRLRTGLVSAALIAIAAPLLTAQNVRADANRLLRDISVLADDSLEGRGTCTPGLDSAAAYIARRFSQLGLAPMSASNGNGSRAHAAYYHRYTARPGSHAGNIGACETQNVVGILRGTDPVLANEYVIVGAHYDHLGTGTYGAADADLGQLIRNGADDNASGTAAVMELTRIFAARGTKRSLVFVTFSGEEWGLLGSQQFAQALPPGRPQAMVNFDMVGRLRNDALLVYGTGTAVEMPRIIDSANTDALTLNRIPDGYGPSDHTSFYAKGMPVLHLFTNTHAQYHRATDDVEHINAAGTARIVEYAARIIRILGDRRDSLTYVAQQRAQPAAGSGTRPYLGSIPDMAAGDVPGQRIADVTPGSPADKGGLKGGDVIVEFAGKPVTDLQTFSDALGAHKPGDTVRVVVIRGTERITLTVTLTARGG